MAFIDLLEIDDSADVQQIRERLKDRYNYFSVLVTTAPTMQLKAIYQKKLSDLRTLAERYSLDLSSATAPANSLSVGQGDIQTPSAAPSSAQAFLVLHTEGKPLQSFPLLPGLNVLGRRHGTAGHTILIDDDYMSKAHAVVEMVSILDRIALLYDIGELDAHKPSTNGVYLNGRDQRISGKLPLKHGDTLQVGYSKLVLTYAASGQQQEAAARVGKTEHSKTVLIRVS
jgi:pSer/pThr/pTyr-binding forkhead associated (FHA) protein